MNLVYERALDSLWNGINGGTAHPNDFGRAVEIFDHLLTANEYVDHPDEISEYLVKKYQINSRTAQDIQIIYEVLFELQKLKQGKRYWNDQFIQKILRK